MSERTNDRIAVRVDAGARLPGSALRIALVLLSATAFLIVPWIPATIVVVLVILGALLPTPAFAWGGILVLGLALLADPAVPTDPRLYAALAVAHLLHVLASLAGGIDPRGTLQARMLIRPLRRWVLIQLPAQACLVGVLLAGGGVASPVPFAPVAAALAAAVAVVVVVLLARRS